MAIVHTLTISDLADLTADSADAAHRYEEKINTTIPAARQVPGDRFVGFVEAKRRCQVNIYNDEETKVSKPNNNSTFVKF